MEVSKTSLLGSSPSRPAKESHSLTSEQNITIIAGMSSAEWLQPINGRFPIDKVAADVITLKQRFPLFDSRRTARDFKETSELPVYLSRVMLEIPSLPLLPIDIAARPIWTRSFNRDVEVLTGRQIITPFHLDQGYQITAEDLDPEARWKKIKGLRSESLKRNHEGDLDYQQTDPLMLLVDAPAALRSLEPLRLLLHLPNSLYVGKMMDWGPGSYFHEYVPADIPHLAEISLSIREGFCIFIPTEPTSVQQIEGEFITLS